MKKKKVKESWWLLLRYCVAIRHTCVALYLFLCKNVQGITRNEKMCHQVVWKLQ